MTYLTWHRNWVSFLECQTLLEKSLRHVCRKLLPVNLGKSKAAYLKALVDSEEDFAELVHYYDPPGRPTSACATHRKRMLGYLPLLCPHQLLAEFVATMIDHSQFPKFGQ